MAPRGSRTSVANPAGAVRATAGEASARAAEIASVSVQLFRQHGFRETTIRDIAHAMNIKSASLYYHYESKDDILFAIAHGLMRDFVREITPVLDAYDDPVEAIRAVVDVHLRFDFSRLDEVLVSARERRSLPTDMQRPINSLRARHRQAVQRRIADGVAQDSFHVRSTSLATSAFLDMLAGVKEWYNPRRDGSVASLVDTYQHIALAMLGHRG